MFENERIYQNEWPHNVEYGSQKGRKQIGLKLLKNKMKP